MGVIRNREDLHEQSVKLKADIDESMARQRAWGTDNFIGNARTGSDLRGMSVSQIEADFAKGLGWDQEDETTDNLAELLGQGITRQGGNY